MQKLYSTETAFCFKHEGEVKTLVLMGECKLFCFKRIMIALPWHKDSDITMTVTMMTVTMMAVSMMSVAVTILIMITITMTMKAITITKSQ